MVNKKIIWSENAKLKLFEIYKYYNNRNKSTSYSKRLNQKINQHLLHQHDLSDKGNSIAVPILKPEHIGSSMAIDEKHIAGRFYKVLSNNETGKIALLAATVKSTVLNDIIPKLGLDCFKVHYLTRDLAQNFDWVGRSNFMNACHVADKFHIHKHLLEAISAVRVHYRQELLTKERLAKQKAIQERKPYHAQKEETLENGDTPSQLLARSRYLLFKKENQWNTSQKARAAVLFKHYPNIEKSYKITLEFREWHKPSMIGKPIRIIKQKLQKWYNNVEKTNIIELLNFKAMVQRHEQIICNWWIQGANAKAEAINRLIKAIVNNHTSIRNLDFAHFRLKTLLS